MRTASHINNPVRAKLLLLILPVKENECGYRTHSAREEKQNAELTDHIGNERLSCLGMPGECNAVIGDEVEEEVSNRKHTKTNY